MILYKVFIIFILIKFNYSRELKFVQAIWRHGDRSPSRLSYPNDIYDESYWPTGWSELTKLGAEQMEELGRFFRERYVGNFISDKFKAKEIYIRSSEADRALTSAQAFVNGMYNLNDCTSNKKLPPVPIHSTGIGINDYLLKPTSADCPAYDNYYETVSSKLNNEIIENYRLLYDFLGNVTGFGPNITTKQVAGINNVQREIAHNLKQPDWLYKTWPEYNYNSTLELVGLIDQITRINEFDNDKLAKLRGGYLLGDWINRAKKVAENKQKNPSKMMLYSSHDGTLLSLLYAMEIGDGEQIPYAGCIIMEIYENDDGTFEAEIYYRKNKEMILKIVQGCEFSCNVFKLYDILQNNAVFDKKTAEQHCQISNVLQNEKTMNDLKNIAVQSHARGSHGNTLTNNFVIIFLLYLLFLTFVS